MATDSSSASRGWLPWAAFAVAVLVAAALAVPASRHLREPPPPESLDAAPAEVDSSTPATTSALKVLSVATHSGLVGPRPRDGGALEPYGTGLLLATGDGRFFRLDSSEHGDGMIATQLGLASPHDERQFQEIQQNPKDATRLRLTDMLLSTEPPVQVFVSHQYWDPVKKCFTLRVSVAPLDAGIAAGVDSRNVWRTIFETSPCLSPALPFDDVETGGRLAWLRKELLLTVGDHGFSGIEGAALAQLDDNAYGKVIAIDPSSARHRIFTKGHRNPQGLFVDADGRTWLSEHGPQGGDEVNVLREGGNYGWPLATYGTNYGRTFWPLAPTAGNHGAFIEPVQAFVPSISTSNLIRVESPLFPEWHGDLLLASLRQNLYRLRLSGERVIYVEPLSIDGASEIRDLTERADGHIFLWTDAGDIVEVAPGPSAPVGKAVFERCLACHETSPAAPSLRGVVGRRAGATPGYDYSDALSSLDATWTEERLDAFLADPDKVVPGSDMEQGRVYDPAERRVLIEFLKDFR